MGKRTKPSIETYLPGFHREVRGKAIHYVNEDRTIDLSRRQAEYVRDGKKTLASASLTSLSGKEVPFPYSKRTGNAYTFKDFFQVSEAVRSGVLDQDRTMIIIAHGVAKVKYPGETDELRQWRAPVGATRSKTYHNDRFWERVIDHDDQMFLKDPDEYTIIFLD